MDHFDLMLKQAHDTVMEKGGMVRPRVLLSFDTTFFYFDYDEGERVKRDEMKGLIQELIIAARVTKKLNAVAFISEIWTSSVLVPNGQKPKVEVMPADDPERKEGRFYAVYAEGKKTVRMWELNRDAKGKATVGAEKNFEGFRTWIDDAMKPLPPFIPPGVVAGAERLLQRVNKDRNGDAH